MQSIIDLNRQFKIISRDQKNIDDQFDYFDFTSSFILWSDVLQKRRVIVLAEAGTGKTAEFKNVAKKLSIEGKFSFFLRIEDLSKNFESSFEIGSLRQFEEWLLSKEDAWIFLDSIDEARLESPRNFESSIRNFANRISIGLNRSYIYISGRVSEWRGDSDYNLIIENLPSGKNELLESKNLSNTEGLSKEKNNEDLEILTLQSLDWDRINQFIEKSNVGNGTELFNAIQENRLFIFASRILDLSLLIIFWEKYNRVGNYSELINFYLELSLLNEQDPTRDSFLPLTPEQAQKGAEIVAASLILTNNFRIQIPDSKIQTNGINLRMLLFNWEENHRRALLNRPIFDDATYGTVRIHHRIFREYLAAKWFLRILKNGKLEQEIINAFFKEKYGIMVLNPKLKSVIPWIASENEKILKLVLQVSPEIMINEGDSSILTMELRQTVIERVCSNLSKIEYSTPSFDIHTLQNFSHSNLGAKIVELYEIHNNNIEIKNLLLRLVWQGRLSDCLILEKNVAIDISQNDYTRVISIRALAEIGSENDIREIVSYFTNQEEENNAEVIGSLIGEFGSKYISIPDLILLIKKFPKPSNKEFLNLSHRIKDFIAKCNASEVPSFILFISRLLKLELIQDKYNRKETTDYYWLLDIGKLSCLRLIKIKDMNLISEPVIGFLSLVANFHPSHYYSMFHLESLYEINSIWSELNLKLFLYDIEKSKELLKNSNPQQLNYWTQVILGRKYWKFGIDDFDFLFHQLIYQKNLEYKLVIFSLLIHLADSSGKPDALIFKLKNVTNNIYELEVMLSGFLNPIINEETRLSIQEIQRINHEIEQERIEQEINETKYKQKILEQVDVLRTINYESNNAFWKVVYYFFKKLRAYDSIGRREDISSIEKLKLEFGESVTQLYIDSAINYWRNGKLYLNFEKNTRYTLDIEFGFSGIEYEVNKNPDFPNYLSLEEATVAFRFAFKKMEYFPDWCAKIFIRFKNEIQNLILMELNWALSNETDYALNIVYKIADLCKEDERIRDDLSRPLFELFIKGSPNSIQIEKEFMKIFLSSQLINNVELFNISKGKLNQNQELNMLEEAYWLAIMFATDGIKSFEVLENKLNGLNILSMSQATEYSMRFIEYLIGNSGVGHNIMRREFRTVEGLNRLYLLLREYIKPEEDMDRSKDGIYTPTLRDDAQNARGRLIEYLEEIPGKETFIALKNLAEKETNFELKAYLYKSSSKRATLDADFHHWSLEEIRELGNYENFCPKNHFELFERIVSIIEEIKLEIEDGDFSDAELLLQAENERTIRQYISRRLNERSNQFFKITQEDELPDSKRPDIRIHGIGIVGPVPIELKIANSWSGPNLIERLENQLCGDYLRDQNSNCGIYLLTNTIKSKSEEKKWKYQDQTISFQKLIFNLQDHADKYIQHKNNIEKIKVIGIDFTIRKK